TGRRVAVPAAPREPVQRDHPRCRGAGERDRGPGRQSRVHPVPGVWLDGRAGQRPDAGPSPASPAAASGVAASVRHGPEGLGPAVLAARIALGDLADPAAGAVRRLWSLDPTIPVTPDLPALRVAPFGGLPPDPLAS